MMARSPREDAFRIEAYQQYLLLANQQDSIRNRLSSQLPSVSSFGETSSDLSSYSTSPASSLQMSAFPQAVLPGHTSPLGDAQSSDLQKLYEVNQQIKATITDLLNVNAVRSDGKLRSLLQSRLMETEIEMRRQRRRRSSVDPEMVCSIAERFEHGSFRFSP